jgi:hypothetical protein
LQYTYATEAFAKNGVTEMVRRLITWFGLGE